MPDSPLSIRRRAFTLIELVVVLAILGMLTALASLSLGGVMDRYQLGCAAEAIESWDGRIRRDASRSRAIIEAVIRPEKNEFLILDSPSAANAGQITTSMPGKVEIVGVKTQRRVVSGRDTPIRFNKQGRSPSYAIELKRGTMTRWLIILGFSGQVIAVDQEEDVDALLSQ